MNELTLYKTHDEALANVRRANIEPKFQAAAAQLALVYGLDPLLKHVVVIPGAGVYPTVAGLRANAERHGDLCGISYRPLTAEEREGFYPGMTAGDIACACTVRRGSSEFTEYGLCTVKQKADLHHRSSMARTRALGRTLRVAYSLNLTSAEEFDDADDSVEPSPSRDVVAPAPTVWDRIVALCGGDVMLAAHATCKGLAAVGREVPDAKDLALCERAANAVPRGEQAAFGEAAKALVGKVRAAPAAPPAPAIDPATIPGESKTQPPVSLEWGGDSRLPNDGDDLPY